MTTKLRTVADLEARLSAIPGMADRMQNSTAIVQGALFVSMARNKAHLTQAELADRLGVKQSRISEMESGKGRDGLSVRTLEQVAAACGGALKLEFVTAAEPQKEEAYAPAHAYAQA